MPTVKKLTLAALVLGLGFIGWTEGPSWAAEPAAPDDKAYVHLLVLGLDYPHDQVKREAFSILNGLKELSPEARKEVAAYYQRRGGPLDYTIATFIEKLGPDGIAVMTPLLDAKDSVTRQLVAAYFEKVGSADPAVIAKLAAMAQDPKDSTLRSAACRALAKCGAPAIESLRGLMKHSDFQIAFAAVGAMESMGDAVKPALADLEAWLKSADEMHQRVAVQVLSRIAADPNRRIELFKNGLTAKEPGERAAYVQRLANMDPKSEEAKGLLPALRTMLPNAEPMLKPDIISAIWKISGDAQAALPEVLKLLQAKSNSGNPADDYYIDGVVRTTGEMGPAAKEALPLLRRMALEDPGINRRLAACQAIAKITDDPAAEACALWSSKFNDVRMIAGRSLEALGPKAAPAVPALIQALDDKDSNIRKHAERILAVVGPAAKPAAEKLVAVAKASPGGDAQLALKAVGALGSDAAAAVPELRAMALGKNRTLAGAAVEALAKIGPPAKEALMEILKRADTNLSPKAAEGFALLDADVLPELVALLKNKTLVVQLRQSVCRAMAGLGAKATDRFFAMLDDPDNDLRMGAAAGLAGAGAAALPDLLKRLQRETNPQRRHVLASILQQMGPAAKGAMTEVRRMLKDSDVNMRGYAIQTLAAIGTEDKESLDLVVEATKDRDPRVRATAATALKSMKPPPEVALPVLTRLLDDIEPNTRSWAIYALEEFGPKAVPLLVRALGDKHLQNRQVAVIMAIRMRPLPIPALVETLKSPDQARRAGAAEALAGSAPLAAPALIEVLKNGSAQEKALAKEILGKLGEVATPGLLQLVNTGK